MSDYLSLAVDWASTGMPAREMETVRGEPFVIEGITWGQHISGFTRRIERVVHLYGRSRFGNPCHVRIAGWSDPTMPRPPRWFIAAADDQAEGVHHDAHCPR